MPPRTHYQVRRTTVVVVMTSLNRRIYILVWLC